MLTPIALLSLIVATPAFAHETHHGANHNQIRGVRFDVHANLDQYSMLGAGGRVEFPIVPDGFIGGKVRDELALSFGADLFFAPTYWGDSGYYGGAYVVPIGVAQWNFYLGERWSVFPEAGIAVHVGIEHDGWYDRHGRSYPWLYPTPDLGIGARCHFNDRVALLLRISTPGGLQAGVTF
jgi:hypothetical protein